MSRLRRHPAMLVWLTLVWVGLWGSVTAANVLGGLLLAVVLLALLPLPDAAPHPRRPLAVLRFLGFFVLELVKASAVVVWLVLRPGRPHQAVLAVHVPDADDLLLTVIANAISLTPGTLTLEVDRARSVLYVHALDVGGPDGVERARRSVQRLQAMAVRAFGPPGAVARVGAGRTGGGS